MRHTSRAMSRGGPQRAAKFIRSEKEEHDFPKGIGGGEEGRERGAMKERLVFDALTVLKDSGRILEFCQEDGEGKDFLVWLRRSRNSRRCQSVEVKSSQRGIKEYMEKVREMTKRGEEFICADLVTVVRDDDTVFSLMNRIVIELGIS